MTNPPPFSPASRWLLFHYRLTSGWTVFGYALALLTATHWPAHFHAGAVLGIGLDKLVHTGFYGVLAWLLAGSFAQQRRGTFGRTHGLWLTPAILLIAGALDEWTQQFTGRTTDLSDWIADAIGIAACMAVVAVFHRLLHRAGRA